MDASTFQQLFDWAQANLAWALLAAFLFAFLESLALIGVFIPGIVLLFAVGALVGWDPFGLMMVWLAAASGALAGDSLSYWLGRYFRDDLERVWPFSRYPHWLASGRVLFDRHGGKSVFIGRFIGPLRPVVPLVAGMLQMPVRPFLAFVVPACVLWAPLYLLPGVVFGASLELAMDFGGRLVVLLVLIVVGTWLVLWGTRLVYEFSARRGAWWLKGLIRLAQRNRVTAGLVGALVEPGTRRESISLALLGLLLTASLAVLLAALALAPLVTPAWEAERQAATLGASLRTHLADPFFVVLSLAGDLQVMALLSAAAALVLIALNRRNAAWHWLVACAGAWLAAELIDGFMGLVLSRPEVLASLGEVPSRAFAVSTATLGFFAVMLAKDLKPRRRKWPYLFSVLLLTLIGFAHFYLARATLVGLVAGLATGGIWVALAGIGFRTRAVVRPWPGVLALAFYGGLVLMAGVHVADAYRATLHSSRLAQPIRLVDGDAWVRGDWAQLPQRRSRVGREHLHQFDVQFAGNLNALASGLVSAGWEPVPALDRESLLAAFSGRPDLERLPHLSRDFAGRPENLAMRMTLADDRVIVLRAWSSGARLAPEQLPIWLVQVREVERGTVLWGLNRWREVAAGRVDAIDALRVAGWRWNWNQPDEEGPWLARLDGPDPGGQTP